MQTLTPHTEDAAMLATDTPNTVLNTLHGADLTACKAAELEYSYYHSYDFTRPYVGSIDDVVEVSTDTTKPRHALWLSAGETEADGTVTTAWQQYLDDLSSLSIILPNAAQHTALCTLDDNAIVLELTCDDDVVFLYDLGVMSWKSRFAGGTYGDVEEYQDDNGQWHEDWYDREITREMVAGCPLYYCDIDYARLRAMGVDAVRVRGERFSEQFSDCDNSLLGDWDVDSIAILRGGCVVEITDVA